jgi:hypothetical protein
MAKGDFFSGFAGFVHDDTAPISQEFERLALEQGWVAKSRPYRAFREECLRTEFEGHFGSNAHDLANWQALCAELGADEIPASKTQAKKVPNYLSVCLSASSPLPPPLRFRTHP